MASHFVNTCNLSVCSLFSPLAANMLSANFAALTVANVNARKLATPQFVTE